jgi:hypothetical protein
MKLAKIVLASTLAVCVPFSPANAGKRPEKVVVTPSSPEGAILLKVPNLPVKYTFLFSKDGKSGFLSRVYLMVVSPKFDQSEFQYIARNLKPGNYRLDSIFQQAGWSVCLHENTFSVDVKPGQITYVGNVDPRPALDNLYRQAVEKGETRLPLGGLHTYWSDTPRPMITGRDDDEMKNAELFVKTSMAKSSAPIRLANINEESFSVSGMNKAIQVCG